MHRGGALMRSAPGLAADLEPVIESRPDWRATWCLFLDVDGTLLEFADVPDAVQADRGLVQTLERVCSTLGGAVALVSGRPIRTLDRLFAPLRLPSAGVHGVERRAADGALRDVTPDLRPLDTARAAMHGLVARYPQLLLEDKGSALALHWRREPALAGRVETLLAGVIRELGPDFELQRGNCVLEVKPSSGDKGTAVESFLREPPFAGRVPLFVGDDDTDADAFRVVERRGGCAVGVGARTSAPVRFANPAAVRRWLERLGRLPARAW